MKTATITYVAPVAESRQPAAEICRTFVPVNAAADLTPFEGTYYDTNVPGWGAGMTVAQYIEKNVFHPGVAGALKKAMLTGEAELTDLSDKEGIFMEELAVALGDQGFTIVVTDTAQE